MDDVRFVAAVAHPLSSSRHPRLFNVLSGTRAALLVAPRSLHTQWRAEMAKTVAADSALRAVAYDASMTAAQLAQVVRSADVVMAEPAQLPWNFGKGDLHPLHTLHWGLVVVDDTVRGTGTNLMRALHTLQCASLIVCSATPIKRGATFATELAYLHSLLELVGVDARTMPLAALRGSFLHHRPATLAHLLTPMREQLLLLDASPSEAHLINQQTAIVRANELLNGREDCEFLGHKKQRLFAEFVLNRVLHWSDLSDFLEIERRATASNCLGALVRGGFAPEESAQLQRVVATLVDDAHEFDRRYSKFEAAAALVEQHLVQREQLVARGEMTLLEGKVILFFNAKSSMENFVSFVSRERQAWPSNWSVGSAMAFGRFQCEPEPVVLCTLIDSVTVGLHLTAATLEVFVDVCRDHNAVVQAHGRIHRLGQRHPTNVVQLVVRDTYEASLYARRFERKLSVLDRLELVQYCPRHEPRAFVARPLPGPDRELEYVVLRALFVASTEIMRKNRRLRTEKRAIDTRYPWLARGQLAAPAHGPWTAVDVDRAIVALEDALLIIAHEDFGVGRKSKSRQARRSAPVTAVEPGWELTDYAEALMERTPGWELPEPVMQPIVVVAAKPVRRVHFCDDGHNTDPATTPPKRQRSRADLSALMEAEDDSADEDLVRPRRRRTVADDDDWVDDE